MSLSRSRGCLLGLAIGDALGAPVEFSPPGSFQPVRGYRAGGVFDLEAGQWTDDTSMALCLAESLLACGDLDPGDQLGGPDQVSRRSSSPPHRPAHRARSSTASCGRRHWRCRHRHQRHR